MFVLGIQGSPRKNGNSDYLLTAFLKECQRLGAETGVIHAPELDIQPCKELLVCEKKGFCPIQDRMEELGYEKVKAADVVVLASPVFFYGVTAQAKIFIDRCQMFWGRQYKLRLEDPDRFSRQGFLLSVAASRGRRLFEGAELTARYFFDAISADYAGSLTYHAVEDAGEVIVKPELAQEIKEAAAHLLAPLTGSRKVLFVSMNGRGRSPMAAAFAKVLAKGRVRAVPAGVNPPGKPDTAVLKAMAAISMDLKYQPAFLLADLFDTEWNAPEQVVFLGSKAEYQSCDGLPEKTQFWEIPALPDAPEGLATIRDEISDRVERLLPRI